MIVSPLLLAILAAFPPPVDAAASSPVVEPSAKLEKLWGEGEFTEGGAVAADGSILFSDIGDRIMRFDPATGKTTVFREPSGRANGLIFDPGGRLIVAEGANTGGGRRISITEPDGAVRTLADRWQGKRFNSPNDVAVDSKGRVYFSDPRYVGDEPRELDFEAVFRVDPDGAVTRLETTARKPNGLVVSPDDKTLYVADNGSKRRVLLALDLDAAGATSRPRVIHDFGGGGGGIDGMTVTTDGRIVATAGARDKAGVWVFSPDGKVQAVIPTPEPPANVEFGGADHKTLYIMAGKSLYRIPTTMTGHATSKKAECLLLGHLPKTTYKRGEKIIPKLEYKNQTSRDLTIWNSGFWPNHKVVVKDEAGDSPPLTAIGTKCRDAFSPAGGRDKNYPIVIKAGASHDSMGVDVASLYQLESGKRYALEIVYDDRQEPTPLSLTSKAVKFEVE